jgi:exosortase E/protease (VPEID-CTERM system)
VAYEVRSVRWLPLVVLIASALTLSYFFDIQQIAIRQSWWAPWQELGLWLPLGFLSFTGLIAATGKHFIDLVHSQDTSRQLRWTALALAAAGVVFWLSALLHHTEARLSHLWTVAWFTALITWISVGIHSVVPLSAILRTIATYPRLALAGLATGTLAYGAGRFVIENWQALAPMTLVGVGLVLRLLGQRPWRGDGLVVGLDDFSVRIAPECSGVEGMGLLGAFLLGFIGIFHRRIRVGRSLALVPLALIASAFLNSVRIALLLLIGANGYPNVALMGFHSKAGWVFFSLVALGAVFLMGTSRALRKDRENSFFSAGQMESDLSERQDSPAAYLMPIVALTFVGLLTESLATDVDHLYFLRILAGLCVFFWLMPPSAHLRVTAHTWLGGASAGILGFVAWMWLVPENPDRAAVVHSSYQALTQPRFALELSARVIGTALVVPLAEELAFRGYLMRRLVSPDFDQVDFKLCGLYPVLASSIIFGALHATMWIPATLCGLLYGAIAQRTGKLSSAIIAHATTNGLVFASVLYSGRFDLL